MAVERRWLKVSEAAAYVGLHPKSVWRACSEHKLPHAKVPGIGIRIDKQALDALLTRQARPRSKNDGETTGASSLPAPQGLCALRAARMLAGISQAQLGQVVGRDHSWVSRLESGEVEASPTEQVKIAEALGVPVGTIFPEQDGED